MAHRLLRSIQTMTVRSLTAALLAAPGCVVPVPLTPEGSTDNNHPPLIIHGKPVDFNMPFYSPPTHDSDWVFGVTVSDLDVSGSENIHARLYYFNFNQSMLVSTGEDIPVTAETPNAQTYSGEFGSVARCTNMRANSGEQFVFYVYVSDAGFPSTGLQDLPKNRFDYKYWVVTCP